MAPGAAIIAGDFPSPTAVLAGFTNIARSARLTFGDQTLELPVIEGTEGDLGLDISKLRSKTGLIALDPGFVNTGACRSAISSIDGERPALRYRGIPIEELAAHSDFLETAWLLIYGRLPRAEELDAFRRRVTDAAPLHESFKHHFDGFPVDAPPMAILSAMVSTLSCFHPHAQQATEEEFGEDVAWLISKARTIAAYAYRRSQGEPFIYPDPRLGYSANFLHMMFSQPMLEHEADPEVVRALEVVLMLHADHEQGCSTTTVRMVGSSRANLFASCAAGICSLWGPVHGGASIAVMEMLESIHRGERTIDRALADARDRTLDFRLKGFGHRIYRNVDPRARVLKDAVARLLARTGTKDPLLEIALELEGRAASDAYFVDRRLYPNADFYNGILMRAIGIPRTMYTVVFALGRMPGWIAQWREQVNDPEGRIARPRQVYVGPTLSGYVPAERRG